MFMQYLACIYFDLFTIYYFDSIYFLVVDCKFLLFNTKIRVLDWNVDTIVLSFIIRKLKYLHLFVKCLSYIMQSLFKFQKNILIKI